MTSAASPAGSGPDLKAVATPATSPWGAETTLPETQQRVVGWKSGQSLTRTDVKDMMVKDKSARRDYQSLRKLVSKKTIGPSGGDPLEGLPPNWQAFWGTVPTLKTQAQISYKTSQREKSKEEKKVEKKIEEKAVTAPAATALEDKSPEDVEVEMNTISDEFRKKRAHQVEKETGLGEWERKLKRLRTLDREEEIKSKLLTKGITEASDSRGQVQGKLRSSDLYFHYLKADAHDAHVEQMSNLTRSCALLKAQIQDVKEEVRHLMHELKERATSESPQNVRTSSITHSNSPMKALSDHPSGPLSLSRSDAGSASGRANQRDGSLTPQSLPKSPRSEEPSKPSRPVSEGGHSSAGKSEKAPSQS